MVALLAFAAALMLAVLVSELADSSILSTAVLFLAVGILLGNGVLQVVHFDPRSPLVSQISEIALFSMLFTDGMRVPLRDRKWRLPGRALVIGLPLTLLATAVLARYLTGLGWTESLLLGAVLAPTDPVFAAAIFKFREVPARLRYLLNVESGMNDGLALPIIMYLLAHLGSGGEQGLRSVGEMALGVVLGAAIAFLGLKLERSRVFGASELYQPLMAIAIALMTFALCRLSGGNLFLAAFTGGIVVAATDERVCRAFHPFGELISELLKLLALFVFGAVLTSGIFADVHVGGYVFAVLTLFLARPLALAIALKGAGLSRKEWVAAAWFGPKGFASVVYGLLVLKAAFPGSLTIVHLVGIVIVMSIVLHSSTDIVVARWFQKDAVAEPEQAAA